MQSPIDPNNSSLEVKEIFSTEDIISSYQELGINVKRFFNSKTISLLKCKSTGYRFFYPFEIIGDAEFYSDLSQNRANYYSVRWEHSKAFNYIGKNDKVLEIGSGSGFFLSMLREKNIHGKGLELNPDAVKKSVSNNLEVKEHLIQTEAILNKNRYDVVASFQVLEHVAEVHDFLKSSLTVLKPGGKLLIGVPNSNPYLFISDKYHTLNLPPHHAGLWNKKTLKSLEKIFPLKLNSIDFEPLEITYEYFIQNQMRNAPGKVLRKAIKVLHNHMPNVLKKISCQYVKGRNILAVYTKTK